MKGPFLIPRYKNQSTVGVRREFKRTWGYAFPESDDYIRELVMDYPQSSRLKCADLILLMHESAGDQSLVWASA